MMVCPNSVASSSAGPHRFDSRIPEMTREVFEGKYELDSLAAILKLSNNYYQYTNDTSCFRPDWIDAMTLIIDTIIVQQASTPDETPLTHALENETRTNPSSPVSAPSPRVRSFAPCSLLRPVSALSSVSAPSPLVRHIARVRRFVRVRSFAPCPLLPQAATSISEIRRTGSTASRPTRSTPSSSEALGRLLNAAVCLTTPAPTAAV